MDNSTLAQYYAIIENGIRHLGLEPEATRSGQPGQWNLNQGSADVWMDLWYIELQERAYFQVMSPIMRMPQDDDCHKGLYKELLQLNDKLFGVAFSLFKDIIWLKTIREADGMDEQESLNILTRVAHYADMYDDFLINKYGGLPPGTIDGEDLQNK